MTNQFLINSCQPTVLDRLSQPFLNNKQTNYKLPSHRAVYKQFNYSFAKWTESESESSKTALVCWLIQIELVLLPVDICVRRASDVIGFVYEASASSCLWITLRRRLSRADRAHVSDGVEMRTSNSSEQLIAEMLVQKWRTLSARCVFFGSTAHGFSRKIENLDFSFTRTVSPFRIRMKLVVVSVAVCVLSDQWTVSVVMKEASKVSWSE